MKVILREPHTGSVLGPYEIAGVPGDRVIYLKERDAPSGLNSVWINENAALLLGYEITEYQHIESRVATGSQATAAISERNHKIHAAIKSLVDATFDRLSEFIKDSGLLEEKKK